MRIACEATHWRAGTKPVAARMTHVKIRAFMPPGARLDLGAELEADGADRATIRLSTRMDDKVAATARLDVVAKASP
jgi:hypothetical protein